MNLYDFVVRRPGETAKKYGLRAYDEVILAPMVCCFGSSQDLKGLTFSQCLFEPRIVEFDKKRVGLRPASHPDVTDEIVEYIADRLV